MGRRKESLFRFRKYCPFEITKLNPAKITPDECREILSSHVGRNSTFYIERQTTTSDIIRPQTFFDAKKLGPTDQQNFLNTKASSIKEARRVFIKTSTLRLYRN